MERIFSDLHVSSAARDYDTQVNEFVAAIIRSVGTESRRQPASMVYELLRHHVDRRLPGIAVDDEALRDAAAKISVGFPV